jgi:CDP-diacylglycerol--serine O-phosphatidyltransferase
VAPLALVYTLAIAWLMVSRLPVFSGKRIGKRVAPEMVLPVFVLVVLFFAVLIAYPWWVLTLGTLAYLGSLPFGVIAYRNHERRDAEAQAVRSPVATATVAEPAALPQVSSEPPADPERPARLN